MLVTGVAPRWLDMVTPKDLQWGGDHPRMSELLDIESHLLQQYKVLAPSTPISRHHFVPPRERILVVIPSDPLNAYERAGYGTWLRDYYNPMNYFHAVLLLSPEEIGPERQEHGMWIIPLPSSENLLPTFHDIVSRVHPSAIRSFGGYW